MRIRQDKDANYKAVFFNNKTVRLRLDQSRPITAPTNPEIEDVAINSKCLANCFLPNSKVRTSTGLKHIEDITTNDTVISYNESTKIFENKEVYELFESDYNGEIIILELENNLSISCTPNHKFLTTRGWVEASSLLDTDDLCEYEN